MSALKIKRTVEGAKKNTVRESPLPFVMTIGHSTRTLAEFTRLLQAHGVSRVVDVRTVPRSRHNPQFNKESLPLELKKVGLEYTHLPGLGGLRHAKLDSLNMGWRNASFRGYADYMQTPEFKKSLDELVQLATREQIVLMCAEAVPWRCHRSLIADALLVRGIRTEDIMSATRRQVHTLTSFAKVHGATVTYPAEVLGNSQKSHQPTRAAATHCENLTQKTLHNENHHTHARMVSTAEGERLHPRRRCLPALGAN
jgi:uncharacterized protein (DUF488 family)